MPPRKNARKSARPVAAAGVVRTLSTARDGLVEFGYFVAACGGMIGILMLLHRIPIG